MTQVIAERNLMFGVVAAERNLVARGALVEALGLWVRDTDRPLGQILLEQGALTDEVRADLETEVDMILAMVGDQTQRVMADPGSLDTQCFERAKERPKLALSATLAQVAGAGQTLMLGEISSDTTAHLGDGSSRANGDANALLLPFAGPRFRILRRHARGGLGEVFLALDTELRREVAVKEIQPRHADDPQSRARFVLEAEVTGRLEHPGIVPIYSLGCDSDGRPFYAMRFVRGESLEEACKKFHKAESPKRDPGERALAVRELLNRFVDVCHAVAFAHSRGVLHRDIKPANILLGPYGETLLVDWGLAKVVGRDEPAQTSPEMAGEPGSGRSSETAAGSAIGTPAYMSPEQADGRLEDLSPVSDVYSLGATLYVILTGKAPVQDRDLYAALRKVREGDFPHPRVVNRAVPASLEAVCLKAMALEPRDRYESARALAEDVEHWLADEPVVAWREPWTAQARRWLGRHRTVVTAGAATAAMALVGLTAVLALEARANQALAAINGELQAANTREHDANEALAAVNTELQAANTREHAANELAQARFVLAIEAVQGYYTGASEDFLLKEPQFEGLRKQLLGTALKFYQRLQTLLQENQDAHTRADLAEAFFSVGKITKDIGSKDEALGAHRRALEIRQKLVDEHPGDPKYQDDLAQSEQAIGELQQALGQPDQALQSFERALAVREKLRAANPDALQYQDDVARSLVSIGSIETDNGRAGDALRAYRLALPSQEALVKASPKVDRYQFDLAKILHVLGRLQALSGEPGEAMKYYERALAIREALAGANPAITWYQYDRARSYQDIARLQMNNGHVPDALQAFERARTIREKLAAANPTVTQIQTDFAEILNNIGVLERMGGKRAEALRSFQRAFTIREKLATANPTVLSYQSNLATNLGNIAAVERETGHQADALKSCEQALAIRKKLAAANPTLLRMLADVAKGDHDVGRLQQQLGNPVAARDALAEAAATWAKVPNPQPADLYSLACIHSLQSTLPDTAEPDRTKHQALAVETLKRALAAGFRGNPSLTLDTDLDPLRTRDDFKMLLLDAGFPANPFAQ